MFGASCLFCRGQAPRSLFCAWVGSLPPGQCAAVNRESARAVPRVATLAIIRLSPVFLPCPLVPRYDARVMVGRLFGLSSMTILSCPQY